MGRLPRGIKGGPYKETKHIKEFIVATALTSEQFQFVKEKTERLSVCMSTYLRTLVLKDMEKSNAKNPESV